MVNVKRGWKVEGRGWAKLIPENPFRLTKFTSLVLLGVSLSAAAPSDVEVAARVDRTEITVGDVVHYSISITYPKNGRVDLPAVRGNVGHFEVQDFRQTPAQAGGGVSSSAQAGDGRTTSTYALTLTSYTLGPDTLPPQRVEYRAAGDTAALVLYTPPTFVSVRRVSPAGAQDIADITGPEKLPGNIPWGLIALAAAGISFWFYRDWRKKHPRKVNTTRAPLPPYEDALEKLRALEQAGLPSQGLGREFAFSLSEIMRGYIGQRFEIDALEATTGELLERAASLPLAPEQQAWLRHFTSDLDTVKYATGALAEAEAARQIEAAREFLHATRPVATSTPPAGPGSEKPPAGSA